MDIEKIKELYNQNQNLTEYFKTTQNKNNLNLQEIELIYDLQSGNYINGYEYDKSHREYKDKYTSEIVEHINNLNFKFDSILEAGIGEGTTFINVIQKLNIPKLKSFGMDISWSRLAYANNFLKKNSIKNTKLVTGLLENLPFLENSIDIVYTSHSIEPNASKEREILKELFRVTKNYLILLEPSYEFGNDEQRKRMDRLSYAKNLAKHCNKLGYKIITHELLENHSTDNNKTEIIIIEKSIKRNKSKDFLACPETKTKLFKNKNFYYSAESFYSYPVLKDIACLNSENKILSTKLDEFITLNKNDPRYNERMFLKSLKEPINEEIIKDMYCPNSIGFLATQENLNDREFMKYIKELMTMFPDVKFKGFYFNKFKNINNSSYTKRIKFIEIKNIHTLIPKIQIFISNSKNPILSDELYKIIQLKTNYVLFSNYTNIREYHKKLQVVDIEFIRDIMINNQEVFKIDFVELTTKNLYEILHKRFCSNTSLLYEPIDINKVTRHQYAFSIVIKLALMSKSYIKNIKTFDKEIYRLRTIY